MRMKSRYCDEDGSLIGAVILTVQTEVNPACSNNASMCPGRPRLNRPPGRNGSAGCPPTCFKAVARRIELTVEDDGVGFDAESRPNLDETHASKHYGLTGMHERASLIGADVNIDAQPGKGTRIQVIWESKESI